MGLLLIACVHYRFLEQSRSCSTLKLCPTELEDFLCLAISLSIEPPLLRRLVALLSEFWIHDQALEPLHFRIKTHSKFSKLTVLKNIDGAVSSHEKVPLYAATNNMMETLWGENFTTFFSNFKREVAHIIR